MRRVADSLVSVAKGQSSEQYRREEGDEEERDASFASPLTLTSPTQFGV